MASLGLCCVHSTRRSYPTEEGAHIALSKYPIFMFSVERLASVMYMFIKSVGLLWQQIILSVPSHPL
jgi:hypothetical protein